MRFHHIIWDYDGTLFNSYPVMAAAFRDTLKEYGFDEPVDTVTAFMKVSMGHAAQHYREKYQPGDAFFERFKVLRKAAEREGTKPFEGAVRLCRLIVESGGKNYLFTHKGKSTLYFFNKYNLTPLFEELVTAEQNFPWKPSPEALLYLMDKYGFSPDDALMIGDRDLDMLSAKNANIHTCYFTDGNAPSGIAEFNINHFSELEEILLCKLN